MFNNNKPLFETKAVSKSTDQLMSVTTQTEQTITSLEVAELTGKRHDHIIRDIRNILSQLDENNHPNFGLVKYTDAKGEERPMYNLTKEGCLCLVSGYDANLRMKIINRWKELELQAHSPSYMIEDKVARAKAWIREEEAHRAELAMKEEQVAQLTDAHTQTLKNNTELVEFITSMFENRSLIAISLIASNYGMGAHDFNLLLHDLGVQHKCSGTWVLNKKYIGHNYTQSLCVGKPRTGWTREGVTFLYTLLKKNGIVPIRERK